METANFIHTEFKKDVSKMTISRWAKKYSLDFHPIRDNLLSKYSNIPAVLSKNFDHSGLIYNYRVHRWKLNEFCNYNGLKDYLLGLDDWINRYFVSGLRCSQLRGVENVDIVEKKNSLCTAVSHILGACDELKERHYLLQKHLIHNDNATIAAEVPVFMYDKTIGNIHGHIDLVQIKAGRVFVLDFKPGAATIDKMKTAAQLYWYSRSLSFRAKIPLSRISCAWFDEQVDYEFEPSKIKLNFSKLRK